MAAPNDRSLDDPTSNPYAAPRTPIEPPSHEPRGGPSSAGSTRHRSAPAATFSLPCTCGRSVRVSAAQAGTTARCDCGAEIEVPSLSRLRQLAGKDPYESGLEDTIRRMVQSGELPAGQICAVSRKPTDDVLDFEILIPRFFKTQEAEDTKVLTFFGAWSVVYLALFGHKDFGEDGSSTVRAPVRIATAQHRKVRGMRQSRLRRILRTIPVYARLLDENPHVRISVPDR